VAADVTGVLLAGGRSTRFGRDKLAEPYRGAPLAHHAARALASVCGEVVVVVAPGRPAPDLPAGPPFRMVRDAREGEGPLAGILAALGDLSTPLALVAGADMPGLAPPVLAEMLRVARAARVQAVVLAEGDGHRPLPCVLRREAREVASALFSSGERSVRGFLGALRVAVIEEDAWRALDPTGETLRDVDRPEDLD
jgi:molybdopterin-guanine dinucleotide biosynthesis protein A